MAIEDCFIFCRREERSPLEFFYMQHDNGYCVGIIDAEGTRVIESKPYSKEDFNKRIKFLVGILGKGSEDGRGYEIRNPEFAIQ